MYASKVNFLQKPDQGAALGGGELGGHFGLQPGRCCLGITHQLVAFGAEMQAHRAPVTGVRLTLDQSPFFQRIDHADEIGRQESEGGAELARGDTGVVGDEREH